MLRSLVALKNFKTLLLRGLEFKVVSARLSLSLGEKRLTYEKEGGKETWENKICYTYKAFEKRF
jgi:hypothetical protein